MFLFLKKAFCKKAALLGLALVLLTSVLFVSCNEPPPPVIVNAQQPNIGTQPAATTNWNVGTTDSIDLTVAATSPDGGVISYQWYSNSSASNTGGSIMDGKTETTLTLGKANYPTNGSYYFYIIVTNTITNNGDGGNKTATAVSSAATVTVSGGVAPVNAQQPNIGTQPTATTNWNVGTTASVNLTVAANVSDGGTLSYQWYSNTSASNTGGSIMTGKTTATLSLSRTDYTANGGYYFYVVVTNTNNNATGTKTAGRTSNAATVNVSGGNFVIYSQADMEKIGVAAGWTLSENYLLGSDITLTNFTPVGGSNSFSGKFDGNNKTITVNSFSGAVGNSSIINNDTATNYDNVFVGIFASVRGASAANKAEIKNMKIHSNNVSLTNNQGTALGLVTGYAYQAVIDNITLSGKITLNSDKTVQVGGIAGVIMGTGPNANSNTVETVNTVVKNCNSAMDIYVIPGNGNTLVTGNANAFTFVGGFVGFFRKASGIESCHNTGVVSGRSTASGSQVMVGGIAGGSFYAFSQHYSGYVIDSSSKGNITTEAVGFWPMAGGIVGLMGGGNGTKTQSTRIERCFATGTVSNESPATNNFPYIGGVVGYIYYGAQVSQCYFNGTVICERGSQDYAGGIAGYSSFATGGSATLVCVVEDCWSTGTVRGGKNAGGIVGQNQQNTILRRCYSTAAVSTVTSSQYGVGGITGLHASTSTTGVTNCVALNPSIRAMAGDNINRVTAPGTGVRANNYAWSGMAIQTGGTYTEAKGLTEPGGADQTSQKPAQSFYQTTLGWDFTNVWKWDSASGYPVLRWQN